MPIRICLCNRCSDTNCMRNRGYKWPEPKARKHIHLKEIERAFEKHNIGDHGQYTWYAFQVKCELYKIHVWAIGCGTGHYCLRNGQKGSDSDLPACNWNVCPKLKELRKEILKELNK